MQNKELQSIKTNKRSSNFELKRKYLRNCCKDYLWRSATFKKYAQQKLTD